MAGKQTHWADEAADKIIRKKGDRDVYTCASGITPSGTVHVGNFREIISVDLVARALRSKGKRARFIYSWDDFDVFRKVPDNMPDPEALAQYLRFPITEVPDPWGRDESYARHHEVDVEQVLPEVGIYPEYLYQSKKYRASTYAEGIRTAFLKRDALKAALDKFRDEEHKIEGDWWPASVFCAQCRHDETEIDGWDGAWALSYHCAACGHRETIDLRTTGDVKLGWRVDWPMRWAFEKVDFEPAGKDHHSQGGSFDTSRLVCKEVYGYDAPETFRYDFIGIKGNPGKMSSSKGKVVSLRDLLKVYTPEIVRYLFAGTRPNTEFTISFDLDVIKIYEDYDKTERIAFGLEKARDEAEAAREKRIYELSQVDETPFEERFCPYQAPFRHFCNLIQIAGGDARKAVDGLPNIKDEQKPRLLARGERALYWLDECAPDEFRFRLRPDGEVAADMTSVAKKAVAALRDRVVACIETFPDDRACAQGIYDVAGELGVEGKDLFRAAYQALIGKQQGPRLANFVRTSNKERLLGILAE
jgi:lysyl-tRNA synthetase class 1